MHYFRSELVAWFAVSTITFAFLAACSSGRNELIAITHLTVIDSTGAPPKADHTVLVSGSRITDIGPTASVDIPSAARIIDGRQKFLIPGLADMHVHLTGAGEPTGSREFILPLLVANGITTVRDMGGKVGLLERVAQRN